MTGARTVHCWYVVQLLREGEGTEACFFTMYLLTLIEHTVSFGRNSFAGDLSMVLRIENLIMNYPYPWKWSFQNELGGIRWDKGYSVCWANTSDHVENLMLEL